VGVYIGQHFVGLCKFVLGHEMKLLGGNQVASLFSSWTNTYVSIQSIMVVNNFGVGGLANKFFSLGQILCFQYLS
jgi:hypothetical protein